MSTLITGLVAWALILGMAVSILALLVKYAA